MSNFRGRGGGGGQRRPWRRRENNWSVRPNNDDELPPEEFTTLSIFPTREDMDPEQATFLRANKVTGRFRDTAHYLDVQFRLLREDYIRPLRNGIQEYRQMKNSGGPVGRIQDLWLYQNVKIVDMTCSKGGLEHFVQFELTKELQRVRWQSSKRLIFGNLVCLSPDDFQTFYFAVVSDRQIKHLHKGIIQVHFENCLLEVLSLPTNTTFTMAESTAFFEAYRHVLEGMQEMQISQSLPFSRYLVDCTAAISPPQYLTATTNVSRSYHRQSASTARMDLSCLLKNDVYSGGASSVAVLNPNSWPRLDQTVLNQSQLDAIKLALTKEVAIIQGPPGTGKTFVGLKVAKILLENRSVWTDPDEGPRPILVVCYTNHALDQFLAGIQKFCPEGIVRVGSRCKDPEIEKFNLKNVRRRAKKRSSRGERAKIGQTVRACKLLQREVIEKSSQLAATAKGIVGVSPLRQYIPPDQYLGLVRGKNPAPAMMGYQSALRYKVAERDAMSKWLTNGQVEEEESEDDIYKAVAAEVTKKILEGEATASLNPDLDPSQINNITYGRRAKLYRAWLQKVKKAMPTQHATGAAKLLLQEIPEDLRLQPLIPAYLYTAIVLPRTSLHHEQAARLTKAWLGVSNSTPPEDVVRLVSQGELLHESRVSTDEVATMSQKRRASLYRYWITTLREKLDAVRRQRHEPYQQYAEIFKLMETTVVDDNVLQILSSPDFQRLFPAIQKEMTKRHERQSRYFIKSWLGVQEFCQNLQDLENVSVELEKTEDDEEEKKKLNVDEEAEILENERHLDDDDEDDDEDDYEDQENHAGRHAAANSSTLEVAKAMQEMDVGLTFDASTPVLAAAAAGGQAWHRVHDTQLVRKIRRLMTSSRPMTSAEAAGVSGSRMWDDGFTVEERVRLYLYWLGQLQTDLRDALRPVVQQYELASKTLKDLRQLEDRKVLAEAEVIGMTTTGAARLRKVLAEVACPIIILEEAAEVLEAHVVTTLHSAAQHLILIGDHKQLRPSTAVYELRDFHLDLSLFERLVNNGLNLVTLAVQHRMRPEVSRLVRHVYPILQDADATQNRSDICGMAYNVFLFHHEQEELRNGETCSRSNRHEAELCIRLCRYLLQQGYAADKITILTAYSGQVFALNNALQLEEQHVQEVRVTSVDNFQGEENDIIILSLVRNNRDGVVGFLSTDNRVCVALSRARNGFYVFGNYKILAEKSNLWKSVFQTAKDHNQTGTKLTLKCVNHPNTVVEIVKAKDFDKAPEGGCMQPCGKRLEKCGHVCKLRCHAYDRDHKEYQCQERCERASACKLPKKERHPCTRRCFQDCGKLCMTSLLKATPGCRHKAMMECHRDPSTWICKERCATKLGCGHQCSMECKDCRKAFSPHSQPCIIMVDKPLSCGHAIQLACNVPASAGMCQKPCGIPLAGCGHVCKGVCGACRTAGKHKACLEKVTKTLACGHQVLASCSAAPAELPSCQKPCQAKLPACGHPCTGICGDCSRSGGAHKACPQLVEKYGPCGHVIVAPCGAGSSLLPACDKPCADALACGHPCKGVCGSCRSRGHHVSCKEQVRKTLPCGHSVQGECGAQSACLLPCEAILKCKHVCKGICGECRTSGHKKCLEKVQKKFSDCRHPVTLECSATTAPPCEHTCNATMKCGHVCDGVCSKCKETGKHSACKKLLNRFQLCGHTVEAECGAATLPTCGEPCRAVLGCGHRCTGICGTCKKKGHSECSQKVERKYQDCSHLAKVECSSTNLPKCCSPCGAALSCGHTCQRVCYFCKTLGGHATCKEQVTKYYKSCQHPVTMECSATKVSPCQNACGTKLPCGHACTGACSACKLEGKHAACKEMVEKRRLCGHTVTVECGKAKLPTCGKPCAQRLECGHVCKGVCGLCKAARNHEPCREMVDKVFEDCKHPLSAECGANTARPCQKPCGKQLPCGHVCQGVCSQCRKTGKHQPCQTVVEKVQPLCGHSVAAACSSATTLPACVKPCRAALKCGHKCRGACGACQQTGDHKKCQERVKRVYMSCGHPVTVECGTAMAPPCESICKSSLPCGHQCSGVCGSCQRRDRHATCKVCDA